MADDEDEIEHGGDAVCWLDRVCDRCGVLQDGPRAPVCPRCGAEDLPAPER